MRFCLFSNQLVSQVAEAVEDIRAQGASVLKQGAFFWADGRPLVGQNAAKMLGKRGKTMGKCGKTMEKCGKTVGKPGKTMEKSNGFHTCIQK